jgi:phosphoglycerol transferase MdoB-like AlkP superfamily enzyme
MQNILNFLKKKISKILVRYKDYFKTNFLFFVFVIGGVINACLLRFFTVKNFLGVYPIIADTIVVALIGAFCYFIKPKKQIVYFMPWVIFFTAICIINSVYYTFYTSFASLSFLSLSIYISDVGDAVVENVVTVKDFVYLWYPITFLVIHYNLKKKNYYKNINKVANRFWGINTLMIIGILLCIFMTTLTGVDISRLNKQWNREYLVMRFGIYTYQINDIIKSLEPKINSIFGYDQAMKYYRDFYDNREVPVSDNKYTNIFKGKNIIAIHAESIQQFVMDLEFNGVEVTPNLNKLAREGLYFSNFYTQVGVGTSSDTEFTLNTSLLPATNGTVFVSYWDREYITIPKLLEEKGYYSFSMHGNNCDFWNREVMHQNMGYNRFYCKPYYEIDETIGLGLSDKSFFRQSVPIIKNIVETEKRPFYATLIMLTNHTPFSSVEKYDEYPVDVKVSKVNEFGEEEIVSLPYMEGTKLGNYFKSVHYADAALGQFINDLEAEGLLDNTVLVIYGDHDARLPKADYERLYNYDFTTGEVLNEEDPNYKAMDYYDYELNRKVPLIIWSKDLKKGQEITTVMGMYDVLPTLGNMFGFTNKYQLGNDIFEVNDNIVVFANGNWLTEKVYYNSQKQEYKMLVDEPITQEYIDTNNQKAVKYLEVSNNIIVYDLIKKDLEQQEIIKQYNK